MEVDLASLPPLISGGDRKARGKAIAEQQNSLRASRRIDRLYLDRPNPAYDSLMCVCPQCRHVMLLDDLDADQVACDRCKREF